jgi:hypothetical protein
MSWIPLRANPRQEALQMSWIPLRANPRRRRALRGCREGFPEGLSRPQAPQRLPGSRRGMESPGPRAPHLPRCRWARWRRSRTTPCGRSPALARRIPAWMSASVCRVLRGGRDGVLPTHTRHAMTMAWPRSVSGPPTSRLSRGHPYGMSAGPRRCRPTRIAGPPARTRLRAGIVSSAERYRVPLQIFVQPSLATLIGRFTGTSRIATSAGLLFWPDDHSRCLRNCPVPSLDARCGARTRRGGACCAPACSSCGSSRGAYGIIGWSTGT